MLYTILDMSKEMRVNDSPNHFMVLDAIGRGMTTADKISTVTKLDKTEVELILNDLAVQRLVNRKEKRGFLRSKIEFTINETGNALLNSKKRELEQKTRDIKQAYDSGNTAQFQSFMRADRAWMPFLLFSGLIDVLFFASAMSFLGMAMSPQESSMAGDTGGEPSLILLLIPLLIQIRRIKKTLVLLTQVAVEAETSKGEVLTALEVLEWMLGGDFNF